MKARLFQFYPSPRCATVRKLLEYKGVEYESIEVDFLQRDEVLALSGQLSLPVLQTQEAVVAGLSAIVSSLEQTFPHPTILPPINRGAHLVLTHYLESQVARVLFEVARPDYEEYFRRQGQLQAAFFQRSGSIDFDGPQGSEPASREAGAVHRILAPFDQMLEGKAFVLNRLGLADFVLYGQLWGLAFGHVNRIPADLTNLEAFFERLNRLSATLPP